MKEDKVFIIMNPTAGDEKGPELSEQLAEIYHDKGIETKIYQTKGEDDFRKIVQDAMYDGYEKIALLGGDGTISELVNGIASFKKRPKIILLPLGTTNNFARTITDNQSREQILTAIKREAMSDIKVDLGQINDKYFVSSIAVGVLPAVGWETDKELKANLGSFAYFLEGLKSITEDEQKSFDLKMTFENDVRTEKNVFLLIIGLSSSIVGIDTFFQEASVNDGQLHYFGLKKAGLISEMTSMINQLTTNSKEQIEDELTFTGQFQQATVESEQSFHFLIDGEKGPSFPVDVGILPEHLTFSVPQSKNKA